MYNGGFKGGKIEGDGKLVSRDYQYTGEFKGGKKSGKGA